MPYAMLNSLKAHGCRISSFFPEEKRRRLHQRVRSRVSRFLPPPLKGVLKQILEVSPKAVPQPAMEEDFYRRTRADASRLSMEVKQRIQGHDLDVLFGCCISSIFCDLDVDIPIVYFSDTTARLIFDTYPQYRAQPEGYRRACEEIEKLALGRASMAVFATDLARNSAIRDYGVPPDRAFTVPMGANIASEEVETGALACEAPSKDSIRLVMTAADPVRKQVDLAVDAVDVLRGRGWAAELELIGPPTPRAAAHPHVRCLGRLSLADASGRRRNQEALRRSHLMILPSLGEAFGIAPCEAALLGKPSIVSAAGGLPEVVLHDVTGIVMGLQSSAEDYAQAIIGLSERPDRYHAMAAAAAARARTTFTWARWGGRLLEIMDRARSHGKP